MIATLLVQNGTLHAGDIVIAGRTHGKVRAMFDFLGQPIQAPAIDAGGGARVGRSPRSR